MKSAESSVEKGSIGNVYTIGQKQVDIINERFEKDNGTITDRYGQLWLC